MATDTKKYCLNCGYEDHSEPLYRTEKDYDGRVYKIEVCRHSRCGELETE